MRRRHHLLAKETEPLQFTFPGGSNYYYRYISGPDYIYSSPIFIKH